MDTEEKEAETAGIKLLPKLKRMHARFVDKLFLRDVKYNGTEAYALANPTVTRDSARRLAAVLLARRDVQAHIKARWAELKMSEDEIISDLTEQAHASIHFFYKPCEKWTFDPLQTHEILEEKEVPDPNDKEGVRMRTYYKVSYMALDIKKVMDPQYAHLIKEFSETKTGYSIKLHDRQAAEDKILRTMGAYKDKMALTDPNGGPLIPPNDKDIDAQYNRSISALADAIRESLSGSGVPAQGDLDTAK